MKKRKLLFLLVLLIIIITISNVVTNLSNKNKFNKEFNALLGLREELIIKIKNNEIQLDEYKFAKLPEEYKRVAKNGRVRVFVNDIENTLIGFLYRPGFPDEDQYIFYTTNDDKFIKEQIGVSLIYNIEKITENWYFVQYN